MPPTAAQAYTSLQDAQKTAITPDAAVAQGESKYGVGELRTSLDALRSLTNNLQTGIENVDPSVRGRTSGSLVTEAQRAAITNNERAPLVSEFNKTGQQLTDTGHQYDEATGLASRYADSLQQADKDKYQRLFSQYTSLTQQEQAAADAAEKKRQFDLSLADSQAARKAAASAAGAGGLNLGSGLPTSTNQPTVAPRTTINYAKGMAPQQAVADAFQGYKPGAKPGFTEDVVIPALQRLITLNFPKYAGQTALNLASKLAYSYRSTKFGE